MREPSNSTLKANIVSDIDLKAKKITSSEPEWMEARSARRKRKIPWTRGEKRERERNEQGERFDPPLPSSARRLSILLLPSSPSFSDQLNVEAVDTRLRCTVQNRMSDCYATTSIKLAPGKTPR